MFARPLRSALLAGLFAAFALAGAGCDTDDGGSSGGGDTSGGGSTGAATDGTAGSSGTTTAGGCETTGDTSGQCQAYADCVAMNCNDCATECADYFACQAACPCGDADCALMCYNNRSPGCVSCLNDQATCIQMNCLDACG